LTLFCIILLLTGRVELTKLRTIIIIGIFVPLVFASFLILISRIRWLQPRGRILVHLTYYSFGGITVLTMGVWMSYAIGQNSLVWLWEYLLSHSGTPLKLGIYFIMILVVMLGAILPFIQNRMPKIITRKYFHLVAFVMFVPAMFIHLRFMSLCFAIAFSLLVVLEGLRIAKVEPVASLLKLYMDQFTDDRDTGTLKVSHIYLLLGCSLSAWYAMLIYGGIFSATSLLIAFSGIACTALSDSVAALVGVNFGRTKWPNSKKSLEGSCGFLVAMIAFQVILLYFTGFENLSTHSCVKLLVADVGVCLLEAMSDQIDNLNLPLFHMTLLQTV